MTQQEFQELLLWLKQKAELQDRTIEKNVIEESFEDHALSEEQLKLVYDYFLANRIRVIGYEKQENKEIQKKSQLTEKARKTLREYRESIAFLPQEKEGEKEGLLQDLIGGSLSDTGRLVEIFMPEIPGIAKAVYRQKSVLIADLIQEGNLSLMLTLESLKKGGAMTAEEAKTWILREIRQSMLVLQEEQEDLKKQGKQIVSKAKDFKDGVAILKEEMGRKVYLDEVADFMNITEEEAIDILKLTGDQVGEDDQ